MMEKPRPIHRPAKGVRSIFRIPEDGALVPRLRDGRQRTEAVGFVTNFGRSEQDGEDSDGAKTRT